MNGYLVAIVLLCLLVGVYPSCIQFGGKPPEGEINKETNGIKVSIYEYWSTNTGWVAIGMNASILSPAIPSLEPSGTALILAFKNSMVSSWLYLLPNDSSTVSNSGNWSTIRKIMPLYSNSSVTASFSSSLLFGATTLVVTFPKLLSSTILQTLQHQDSIIVALNSLQNMNSSLSPTSVYTSNMPSDTTKCNNIYGLLYREMVYAGSLIGAVALISAILMCIGLVHLISIFLYRKHSRVNSRWPTIFIITLLLILVNLLDILMVICTVEQFQVGGQTCWVLSISLFVLAFLMYMILLVRYFHARNVYNLISKHKNKTPDQLGRILKLHKKLLSKWTSVVVTALIFLPLTAVFIVIGIFANGFTLQNRDKQLDIARFAITAVMFVFELLALILDTILNWSTLRKKGIRYHFGFGDPLGYRIEMLFAFLIPTNAMIVMIVDMVLYSKTAVISSNHMTAQSVYLGITSFFLLLEFIVYYSTAGGGIALIYDRGAYWYKLFKYYCCCCFNVKVASSLENEEVKLTDIEAFLTAGDENMSLMEEYCEKEFSSENLMLWKELYAMMKNGHVSFAKASELVDNYIVPNSIMEVNLDGATRRTLLDEMQKLRAQKVETVEFSVFNRCYNVVSTNLADTFSRLSKTNEYEQLVAAKKLEKEILEKRF